MKYLIWLAFGFLVAINLYSQKRQSYFGITGEVGITSAEDYPSAVGTGVGGQLSYWLNEQFVLVANTGFIHYTQLVDKDKFVTRKNYYLIPLMAGIEYNFSKETFAQFQVGNMFAKNVYATGLTGAPDREVKNALSFTLALGFRLTEHSDVLVRTNHTRFNVRGRVVNANNNAFSLAYVYSL